MLSLTQFLLIAALIQIIIFKTQATEEYEEKEYEDIDCPVLKNEYCFKSNEKQCSFYEIKKANDNGCSKNCKEIKTRDPSATSGIYPIWPTHMNTKIFVYCDMETSGGGWTVFQRRTDNVLNHISFNRTWKEYRDGFGHLHGEFWLGNDVIYVLSNDVDSELRIDMEDHNGLKRYATHQIFRVLPETEGYKLIVNNHYGDTGYDALSLQNKCSFQTHDRSKDYCAKEFGSGWWFCKYLNKNCYITNLNGFYTPRGAKKDYAIMWGGTAYNWKHPLKFTEMKMRPKVK